MNTSITKLIKYQLGLFSHSIWVEIAFWSYWLPVSFHFSDFDYCWVCWALNQPSMALAGNISWDFLFSWSFLIWPLIFNGNKQLWAVWVSVDYIPMLIIFKLSVGIEVVLEFYTLWFLPSRPFALRIVLGLSHRTSASNHFVQASSPV